MRMARSLNLAKFTALERLTIGYVRDGELPLEDVAIPPALQILVVHWWDDDHSRKLTKVEFSFSSEAVMEDFLRHEASAEVAKLPKDGRLTVSILGPAQPSLVGLCNDRGIQLFVSPRVSGEPTTGNIGLQSHVLRWTSAHISIV
ncbi:hypothetical protein PUNSTDRAFT_51911 [Punctularia strigosozonata HHB-11173 SS5]|uniref:uncharacterized protein n=1 Tax=Punctularia strigosozonata (strain HHB-11173) TaxID=741275 RepID=UPI0004417773|nr:uncharacterized protein PUNSTDRAFT_51911 [Punctularia strigosozonata HHB-11173 SS5]EIN09734.1 hypothetical protein PUNSTDRAFT_51911 [Punctularia strigosozonata HHB-11173 SS5]